MTESGTDDWTPSTEDFSYVSSVNQPYVKSVGEGEAGPWEAGGSLVLLGEGHSSYADWVRGRPDYESGTFTVIRPTIGAGKLIFTGATSNIGAIKSAVAEFSDKAVEFQ